MKEHPCGCRLFFAPIGVQLDCDDRTVLEPDLIIFCDDGKMRKRVYYGAPDFVVEILSPSTKRKDVTIKLRKYIAANVREYWIVDPETERVFVYQIEAGELPLICGYGDQVPVGISGGKCSIDFTGIWDSARELKALE
jgi:Uma2 family endonuclease